MRLDRDSVNKISLVGGKQRFDDFRCQDSIFCPTQRIFIYMVHIFQGGERIKPQMGENQVTIIKGAGIVMNYMGTKAKLF